MPIRSAGRFFRFIYLKIFRINDTPQKIAAGVGIGVFCGVLPGIGPFAALGLAFLLRANRAGALLGSILTNTWLSVPLFFVAVKAGAVMTNSSHSALSAAWESLSDNFRWSAVFKLSFSGVILPVMAGYLAVSLAVGATAYIAAFAITEFIRNKKMERASCGDHKKS